MEVSSEGISIKLSRVSACEKCLCRYPPEYHSVIAESTSMRGDLPYESKRCLKSEPFEMAPLKIQQQLINVNSTSGGFDVWSRTNVTRTIQTIIAGKEKITCEKKIFLDQREFYEKIFHKIPTYRS